MSARGLGGGRTIYFLTPTLNPVGGVVKIFDYVNHARALGFSAVICSPEGYEPGLPLFSNGRFRDLTPEKGVRFTEDLGDFAVGPEDLVFVSWPSHYRTVEARLAPGVRPEQVLCVIQNVRWGNPLFEGGYAVRLLSRPMTRIMTNDVVYDAVSPYLSYAGINRVIPLGHDCDFFRLDRGASPLGRPVRVAYTTWKSALGDRVAAALAGEGGFEFRSIRKSATHGELRDLYRWSDVFLATPLVEEGFYMPALEAMAAGSIVITPDAGGNMAYCRFGENCLGVGFESVDDYVRALRELRAAPVARIAALRAGGYAATAKHTLPAEERGFARLVEELLERLGWSAAGERR